MRSSSHFLAYLLGVLLLLATGSPLSGQPLLDEQRARVALDEGRLGEALLLLDRVIATDASNANAVLLRARTYEARGEFDRAITEYNRVLQLNPQNILAREGITRARQERSRRVQQDVSGLRAQVTSSPGDLGLLLRYANQLYEARAFREAAAQYLRYLERGQPVPDIVERLLISIASYEGDAARGEQQAERFLRYYPADSNLHMRLGYFRFWQGKRQEAILAFDDALRLNPSNRDAARGLEQARSQPASERSAVPREFIIDRLLREVVAQPDNTTKRFELIEAFVRYERYYEAYEHLLLLPNELRTREPWRAQFIGVDEALTRQAGPSPDRLVIRLSLEPQSLDLRYSLVKALMERGRLFEAYDYLTTGTGNGLDPQYQTLLRQLLEEADTFASRRIGELESRLQQQPGDAESAKALIDLYMLAQRPGDALALYESLLARQPEDHALRLAYVRALWSHDFISEALSEAQRILARNPTRADFRKAYVVASVAAGQEDVLVEPYIREIMQQEPADALFFLDLVDAYLAAKQPSQALTYLQHIRALPTSPWQHRVEATAMLVERHLWTQKQGLRQARLHEAQALIKARAFDEAADQYEALFSEQGFRSRAEMKALAQVFTAAGDTARALDALQALYVQYPELDVAKQIAKHHLYTRNYRAARRDLEALLTENPVDFELRLLLGDTYRELELYDQARDMYRDMLRAAPSSHLAHARLALLEQRVRAAGSLGGFSYGMQVTPISQYVRGAGSGTSYERLARGARVQVFAPLPIVLEGGYLVHTQRGTRRLVPDAERVQQDIQQVYGSGYVDLTRPVPGRISYTNRLAFEGGLYLYPGGRSEPFASVRYHRHVPGRYAASVGLLNTEGSMALWSPAGDEFDLRLSQVDIRLALPQILPDSSLRLESTVLINVVTDKYATLGSATGSNTGVHLLLDAAYRVLPETYLGLRYDRLDYQSTVDIYYSPNQFQSYFVWLEYLPRASSRMNLRMRGSLGLSARTSGFVSRHFETDLAYRLARSLSLTINASVGQSSRPFVSTPDRALDSYSTFVMSAVLAWSL